MAVITDESAKALSVVPDTGKTSPAVVEQARVAEVDMTRLGRIVMLEHADFGKTVMVDVTDLYDPTTIDPEGGHPEGERVRDLMDRELGNPQRWDTFNSNNSVVVAVTDKFGAKGEGKVFIGIHMTDPADPEIRDITTHILDKAGFSKGEMYVPMSFDSGDVPFNIRDVFLEALEELGDNGEEFHTEVVALLGSEEDEESFS